MEELYAGYGCGRLFRITNTENLDIGRNNIDGIRRIVRHIQFEDVALRVPFQRICNMDWNEADTVCEHFVAHRGTVFQNLYAGCCAVLEDFRAKCDGLHLRKNYPTERIRIGNIRGSKAEFQSVARRLGYIFKQGG